MSVLFAANGTPREGAFNVNGMRSTSNNFLMDGLDNNADSTSNQQYSNQVAQPSPDAMAEFRVVTNNYSAEYGRVSGASVSQNQGPYRQHQRGIRTIRTTYPTRQIQFALKLLF